MWHSIMVHVEQCWQLQWTIVHSQKTATTNFLHPQQQHSTAVRLGNVCLWVSSGKTATVYAINPERIVWAAVLSMYNQIASCMFLCSEIMAKLQAIIASTIIWPSMQFLRCNKSLKLLNSSKRVKTWIRKSQHINFHHGSLVHSTTLWWCRF